MQSYYYNSTLKKLTNVFGSLFNEIKIKDSQNKEHTVPIAYGPKRHYFAKLKEEATRNEPNISITLPRLSFAFGNPTYAPDKQLSKQQYYRLQHPTDQNLAYKQPIGVPYDISYELNIFTKNTGDMLEIVEQILPFFAPNINVTIKEVEDATGNTLVTRDVNIRLNGIDTPIDYEGVIGEDRVLQWTLMFTASTFLYPQFKEQSVIKKTITTVAETKTIDGIEYGMGTTTTVSVNPPTAGKDDVYTLDESSIDYLGTI